VRSALHAAPITTADAPRIEANLTASVADTPPRRARRRPPMRTATARMRAFATRIL
jgi:hypothetical protein